MADDELDCDSCDFHYRFREVGSRCSDLSWRDHDCPMVHRWPVQSRGYRSWLCRGRLWPSGSAQLRNRDKLTRKEQLRRYNLMMRLWDRNQKLIKRIDERLAARQAAVL